MKSFPSNKNIKKAEICIKSGKKALPNVCSKDPEKSMVRTEYFASGTVPKDSCDAHIAVTFCLKSHLVAQKFCPDKFRYTKIFRVRPKHSSHKTDDEPYFLNIDINNKCNIHTEEWHQKKLEKKKKKQEESVIQDMPEKRDKEIKTVIAEQMISDKEEKADESDVNIRKVIIGVVSMAFGLLGIFVPGLIPFRIPSVLSFICIGAGIGILVFCKKEHKKLQSVILTQKQSIPYVVKKDTAQVLYNESVNVNNKCIEEKTVSYDDICNETMLLSEYMPEKNSRKELKLVLQKENLIGEVLIYIRGVENEDGVICMDKYPYVIGSFEKMSDVVIKAQVVSRMHCCIYHEAFKADEYLVEDLNATNGTYLNGERLGNHERKKLSDGDVLKIAAISFKVEIS